MKLTKKSTVSLEMVLWIPRLIFLVIAIFSVSLLIRFFIIENIDISNTEASVFSDKILLSKSLNYFDKDAERYEVGTIDLKKFQSDDVSSSLENEISYNEKKKIGAKISLKNLNKNTNYQDIFYRKDFYEEKKVLVDAGFTKGQGGAKSKTKSSYVLLEDGISLDKGIITIEVVMSNS